MKFKAIVKGILKFIGFFALFIAFYICSLFYEIPFIEGDWQITTGERYGFKIGMSRKQCFEVLKEEYSKEGYLIYAYWENHTRGIETIREYQKTLAAVDPNRSSGLYREKITSLGDMLPPLEFGEIWNIKLPSIFSSNAIQLEFAENALVKIRRYRLLFERL